MTTLSNFLADNYDPILNALVSELAVITKNIAYQVRRAGLSNLTGTVGYENIHGEKVQKLDAYAQELIETGMARTGYLCCMASEESPELIAIPRHLHKGEYVLSFDPLDGSSNIDVNISIGTIFSIHKRVTTGDDGRLEDALQPGHRQLVAGYVLYGSSTMIVLTNGRGVQGFTLDPTIGEFILSHPNITIPVQGKTYSINEGNVGSWSKNVADYVDFLKGKESSQNRPYSLRYVGTLVADFHRTLINGGIFLYPASPKPKLRLLYEAAPMALIVVAAGGKAITDSGQDILDLMPTDLHQKVPLVVGSIWDVEQFQSFKPK